MYISTEADLAAFCDRAAAFDAVAVDTEFLRERTYHPRLCLVQVATPEESVAIDPIALGDLAPLADLLANERVIKVFHACPQDMEVLLQSLGVLPAPIFDTQVAAAFLGERLQTSYNGLVHAFLGISLPKSESLTDWSRRPLTEKQLEYARFNAGEDRVSAGPYNLVAFDKGSLQATLTINPNYAGNFEGQKPSIEKIVVTKTEDATWADALKTGAFNFYDTVTATRSIRRWTSSPRAALTTCSSTVPATAC